MATYLLLRNNRESGPLTKDQLIALGLKPYDLIWVDGRSAAWRYANEIPELKDHAPAVEEQPYDRFYKKNTPDPAREYVEEMMKKHTEQPAKKYVEQVREPEEEIAQEYVNELKRENAAVAAQQPISDVGQDDVEELLKKYGNQAITKQAQDGLSVPEETDSASEQLQKEHAGESINDLLGKQLNKGNNGSVSVIMPKQASPVKREEPLFKKVTVVEKQEPPVVKRTSVPVPVSTLDQNQVNVETKYSTPLDEIKERYVKQLTDRKHASAQRKFIVKTLKRAAIFIVVIGAGVMIGFAIKPRQTNKKPVVESNLPIVPLVNNNDPVKDETVLTTNTSPEEVKPTTQENVEQAQTQKKEDVQETIKPSEEKKILESPSSNPSAIESANGERSKNIRSTNDQVEPVEKRSLPVGDLSGQVSVKANDYKERDFGGFRNLQLTVTNDSKVTLESVLVEVTYKKYNEDIASVKNIPFHAISPGESLTIKVPDNNRGAKLSYRIISIDPRNP